MLNVGHILATQFTEVGIKNAVMAIKDPKVLRKIVDNIVDRLSVLEHEEANDLIKRDLCGHVILGIVENKHADKHTIGRLFRLIEDFLLKYDNSKASSALYRITQHKNCPCEVLSDILFTDKFPTYMRFWAVGNHSVTTEMLRKVVVLNTSTNIRMKVTYHPNVSEDILKYLCRSKSLKVLNGVANSHAITDGVAYELLKVISKTQNDKYKKTIADTLLENPNFFRSVRKELLEKLQECRNRLNSLTSHRPGVIQSHTHLDSDEISQIYEMYKEISQIYKMYKDEFAKVIVESKKNRPGIVSRANSYCRNRYCTRRDVKKTSK